MKVLVVGGAGYVGGVTVDVLLEAGHDTRVYDALLYEESYRKPVNFVYGDIRDHDLLQRHLNWADSVVWLAALVGDGACSLHPDISVELNQDSVKYLVGHFDGKIIFTSTCSVYGAQDGVLDEDAPVKPLSLYGLTKAKAEEFLRSKDAIIFRLGTLFGIGDDFSRIRLDLVVNVMTANAALESVLKVFGGNQFRPLLHVRDVAKTIVESVASKEKGTFNLHRQNVRIMDLAYEVRNHFPDIEIVHEDINIQDTRNYRVLSDRAREKLGFKPVLSLDTGIEELKELIESHRLVDVTNPRYTNQRYLSQVEPHLRFRKETRR